MQFNKKVLKQIEETKYLSTENTWRYRAITRCLYKAYEKLKYALYREEIMDMLKKYEEFDNYSEDNLKSDLDSLVDWNNLIGKSDTLHVKSLEEYMNKVLIYQLSPYTVEIERMLINLENMDTSVGQQASLESFLVEVFKETLFTLFKNPENDNYYIYTHWNKLNDSFIKLNENYKDYISNFYSPITEELMKTTEFLLFKETFINYLRSFVKGIQVNGNEIKLFMESIEISNIKDFLEKSASYEETVPRMTGHFNRDEYVEINLGRYESMKEWFCWSNGKAPLYEQIIDHTNEIIRKITRFAFQIADKRNTSVNRKQEYNKIMEMFSKCDTIEDCHKLSSLVFGVPGTKHVLAAEYRESDSSSIGIYEETPKKVILKPRVRTYREKAIKNPINRIGDEKETRMREILEQRKKENALVRRLIVNNEIDFKTLPEISSKERNILLRWISRKKPLDKKSYEGKTEFGENYIVLSNSTEMIQLKCDDGCFFMPHFVIKFIS